VITTNLQLTLYIECTSDPTSNHKIYLAKTHWFMHSEYDRQPQLTVKYLVQYREEMHAKNQKAKGKFIASTNRNRLQLNSIRHNFTCRKSSKWNDWRKIKSTIRTLLITAIDKNYQMEVWTTTTTITTTTQFGVKTKSALLQNQYNFTVTNIRI